MLQCSKQFSEHFGPLFLLLLRNYNPHIQYFQYSRRLMVNGQLHYSVSIFPSMPVTIPAQTRNEVICQIISLELSNLVDLGYYLNLLNT